MKIERLCALNLALMIFMAMNPYITWIMPDGFVNILFLISTIVCTIELPDYAKQDPFMDRHKILIGIALLIYIVYFTLPVIHEMRVGHFIWFLCFLIVLSYRDFIVFKAYSYLKRLFVWIAIFALIFWILNIIRFPLPYYLYIPDFRGNSEDVYRIYGFAASLYRGSFPIGGYGVERIIGVFGEPGHFGIYIGLILAVDKFNFSKKENVLLLITGILTFSTAFYGILALGLLYRALSDRFFLSKILKPSFIVFLLLIFGLLIKSDALREVTYRRVLQNETERGVIELVEQRSREDNKEMFVSFIKSPEILFGKGYFISSIDFQSTNWRGIFFRFGIIGFLIILFLIFSIAINNDLKYGLLLFFMAALIFSHRSFLSYASVIYILLYMATVVNRIRIKFMKNRMEQYQILRRGNYITNPRKTL